MGKELIISGTRHETKVAVLEDDQLVEIYFQRANEYSLAGSIHKGRVTRVLPGMQSAFVNIGLERDAFLYVSDFFEEHEEYDRIATTPEDKPIPAEKPEPAPAVAAAPAETPAAGNGREEEGDFRDRRGRRARRRRGRDRGFPESKYASEVTPPRMPVRQEVAEPVASEPRAPEFPVLPGESLAKYRRAEEQRTASPTGAEPTEEGDCELDDPPPQVDPDPPGDPAESSSDPPGEPQEMAEQVAAEPAKPVGADETFGEPDREQPQELPEAPEADEVSEQIEAEERQEAPEAGQAEPSQEVEPARTPVSLPAALREQGYRYMHRVSRRMRRRMRPGAFPEDRPEAPKPTPEPGTEERAARPESPAQPSISELLREGQEILVQIAKEPLGQKGARITSHIALPGRYVVYMPTVEHLGVSRKIASDDERLRLKRILQSHRAGMTGGFIVRTAGEGRSEHDIATDMEFLYNLWQDMRHKAESRPAPALLHHDLDLVQRILRDQMTDTFKAVWADNEEIYESVLRFVQRFQPGAVGRVKLYTRDTPIFDAFNITSELEKALRPKVWLKSGGYIVINQTEALVAIDVNTGKFVGKSNRLEDTILKTNLEAVKEIVRQVRLRDLGGIIVVDFIDMDERKNRQKVMQALEEAMRADRAPNKILQFNDFGLVAITRKRVKQSLERTLCSPCPYCEGAGYVKSAQTVIGEILQEARNIAKLVEGKEVMLRVNPEVAKILKSSENDYLEELEEVLGRPVLVTGDPALQQEKFDLV
jgi:ribonuclease G